ncbi:acyl-CoA thioesterase [Pseudomaricurvus alkylphenolicus]|jgi:acyl-CoA thioester hydrolase|uniref:acyl-CoA thioesterase n=1 Tax=Pseudomaricurvus alkylphenolicus TaxID=1306991 RepID=UPI00142387AA|nr:thioesterase family protein [Pseudomaricurvus alkylphenolicus]NIB42719.1 acyl-CoA thioesterase [Pseudomaricurvus alkylphenolicus]
MHPLLEDHPYVYHHKVTWGELDAFQHVNNTEYFRYFEHARIGHFTAIGIMAVMASDNTGPILAETRCRFKAPLDFPDEVYISAQVKDLKEDCFTHVYTVVSERHNRVVAEGEGKIVYYDYNHNRRCPLPPVLLQQLQNATGKE